MKIQLTPQVRMKDKIWYKIEDQIITATINDVSDTFDFTDIPDGELQLYDDEGNELIETKLDEVPIASAKRENGELFVKIVFSISMEEKDERLLFPKPMTLDEFNALMDEIAEREKPEEDDIMVEDERLDGEELVHKDDHIIDLEEVDF